MNLKLSSKFKKNFIGPSVITLSVIVVLLLFSFKQSPAHISESNSNNISVNDLADLNYKERNLNKVPIVEVIQVKSQQYTSLVKSQGRVQARWNTKLKAEVSGEVFEVSEHLLSGALFKKDDILVQIDPLQYELEVLKAKAEVADANYKLLLAEKNTRNAIKNWKAAGFFGEPTDLAIKKPQYNFAQAKMKFAILNLKKAEHDLELTKVKAPYDGVAINRKISPGSYLTLGSEIALISSTEILLVSLPITRKQLLRLPENITDVTVTLTGENDQQQWYGQVSRLENIIDSKNRVRNLIVSINNDSFNPLILGQFVKAEIKGTENSDIIIIPNSSISNDKLVWFVSENNRLRVFKAKILFEKDNLSYIEVKYKNLPNTLSIVTNPSNSLLLKSEVSVILKKPFSTNIFDGEV